MLRVMRNHRRAAYGAAVGYEAVRIAPVPLDDTDCPDGDLIAHARRAWDKAVELGEAHGYRNAQATVIAPTGTIGLVMDCDTTGIEPDFALVKFKKLAGGGYFKIINQAVPEALRTLGYDATQIEEIITYAVGHGTLQDAPALNHAQLRAKGFGETQIETIEAGLASAFDIKFVFNKWTLGEEFCRSVLKISDEQLDDYGFDLLVHHRLLEGRYRPGQYPCLRGHDAGRRSRPQGRASAGLRLRQCLRPPGQALSLGRKPYPHDGGKPALHLRRHFQDHQHAE